MADTSLEAMMEREDPSSSEFSSNFEILMHKWTGLLDLYDIIEGVVTNDLNYRRLKNAERFRDGTYSLHLVEMQMIAILDEIGSNADKKFVYKIMDAIATNNFPNIELEGVNFDSFGIALIHEAVKNQEFIVLPGFDSKEKESDGIMYSASLVSMIDNYLLFRGFVEKDVWDSSAVMNEMLDNALAAPNSTMATLRISLDEDNLIYAIWNDGGGYDPNKVAEVYEGVKQSELINAELQAVIDDLKGQLKTANTEEIPGIKAQIDLLVTTQLDQTPTSGRGYEITQGFGFDITPLYGNNFTMIYLKKSLQKAHDMSF